MPSSANQLDLLVGGHRIPMKPFDGTTYRATVTTKLPSFSDKISRGDQKARSSDPVESHDAAESMEGHAKEQEAVVLAIYAAYPDLTSEECSRIAGRDLWRRTSDLLKAGKLVDTGLTRTNASGRKARVLRCP